MRRLHLAVFAALIISAPAMALPPPGTMFGSKWNLAGIRVAAVGDITADAGLECIGEDDLNVTGLYRLGNGMLLQNLPAPFGAGVANFTLRDVDNDGLAEILCVIPYGQGQELQIGLLDYNSGLGRLWPDLVFQEPASLSAYMNLGASVPQAVVVALSFGVSIVDLSTGTIVYASASDPQIPTGWHVESTLVDDFDLDGYDDLLLTLIDQTLESRTFLIGAINGAASVDGLSGPGLVKLQQSWPNPVNGSSTIRFEMEKAGRVRLQIFDVAGRLVRTIVNDGMPAGSHTRVWDGRDEQNHDVASGIYFYELDVDGQRQANKLVQVR